MAIFKLMPICALFCLLAKYFVFTKIKTEYTFQIFKWGVIVIALVNIFKNTIGFVIDDVSSSIFFNRISSNYWYTYLIMILGTYFFPLFLLNRKLGNSRYYLLFVSIMMNIWWIFELFVIGLAMNRDYIGTAEYEKPLLIKLVISYFFNGFILWLFFVIAENIILRYKNIIK